VLIPVLVVVDVDSDRDRSLIVGNQFAEDWVSAEGNQGRNGNGFRVEFPASLEIVGKDFRWLYRVGKDLVDHCILLNLVFRKRSRR